MQKLLARYATHNLACKWVVDTATLSYVVDYQRRCAQRGILLVGQIAGVVHTERLKHVGLGILVDTLTRNLLDDICQCNIIQAAIYACGAGSSYAVACRYIVNHRVTTWKLGVWVCRLQTLWRHICREPLFQL